MKVLKLADGRYVARWRDPLTGRQQQQSLDKLRLTSDATRRAWATSKADAVAELRRAVSLGAVRVSRVSVRDAVAEFLDQTTNPLTKSSRKVPLEELADRLEHAGVASLSELAGPTLMTWRDWVIGKRGYKESTKNRWLGSVCSYLRWARKRGMAPLLTLEAIADGCQRVAEPREAIVFLRPAQLRQVLASAIAHDQHEPARRVAPFVLALMLTGCRLQELCGLVWREVQADGIHLPASRTKTKHARLIAFTETPSLRVLFDRLRPTDAKPDALVFPAAGSQWEGTLARLIRHHNAPTFSAHTLRRSAGTVLTNAPSIYGGASAWQSAKRLGHSVAQAERDYAGQLVGLPTDARTFEAAAGIEDLATKIAKGE